MGGGTATKELDFARSSACTFPCRSDRVGVESTMNGEREAPAEQEEEHYAALRREMVHKQLRWRHLTDDRLLEAMERVPRHCFVPASVREDAYADRALAIGSGQTISQPYMVATMVAALRLRGSERVLDVGCGSGYQAAVLSLLARQVIGIERLLPLVERARQVLEELGYDNVTVVEGDGTLGYKPAAPYEGIIVGAGAPEVPQPLLDQLADGGRLVIPVGDRRLQRVTIMGRRGDQFIRHEGIDCVFVPLLGDYGWDTDTS